MYKIIVVNGYNKIYEKKLIDENSRYIVKTIEKFSEKDKQIILKEKELIILLDLDVEISYEILDFIVNLELPKLKNSIILEGNLEKFIVNNYSMSYVYEYIKVKKDYNQKIITVKNLIQEKKRNIELNLKNKIHNILHYLKFNFSHVGTIYLAYAIEIIYLKKLDIYNLEKDIYPIIAKTFNTKVQNVKHAIIKDVNLTYGTYSITEKKFFSNYFKCNIEEKITPKHLICIIINKI